MRFSTILAALPFMSAALVQGAEWPVTVGAGGNLTFTPNTIDGAAENDTIKFTLSVQLPRFKNLGN